jgi:hypothetical protein
MTPVRITVVVLLFSIWTSAPARAEEPPPIQVIFDLHMDPLNGIPLNMRPEVYANWREAADWLLDTCAARGAVLTFLSTGEYMEYTLADPASWPLIARLAAGGTLGTHSHIEKKYGPHDWRNLPPNPPMDLIVAAWHDHTAAMDLVINAALGITDPEQVRALNNERGAHLPSNDAARIDLMAQFGFTMHQQGPEEEFYAYFGHYVLNPYRPSGAHFLSHDPAGPVVVSPFGPVLGVAGLHGGVYQDLRLPAAQTLFLLTLLNWLDDACVTGTSRVWDFGWAAHGSDIVPGQPTRAAVEPMLDWLKTNFVDQPVSGRLAMSFSSAAQSRDLYLAWEAGHPDAVPFDYPANATDWALYPYLLPVARYLAGGQYVQTQTVGAVQLHEVTAAAEIGGPYDLYVVLPSGADAVVVDLSPGVGPGTLAAVVPRTGLSPPVATDAVLVPPTGLLLVPTTKRLGLCNGDVNLDGYLDFGDINPFVAVLTGQDTDPQHHAAADINRDGQPGFGDINPFVALLSNR